MEEIKNYTKRCTRWLGFGNSGPLSSITFVFSKLYFTLTVVILFAGIFSGYFVRNSVLCIASEMGNKPVTDDMILDYCEKFGIYEDPSGGRHPANPYYKVLPWGYLMMAAFLLIPIITKNYLENKRLQEFLKEVYGPHNEGVESEDAPEDINKKIKRFVFENMGTFNNVLKQRLSLSCMAMLSAAGAFVILNELSQGAATGYAFSSEVIQGAYPDHVTCVVSPEVGLAGLSTKFYGCELKLNVYHRIVFLFTLCSLTGYLIGSFLGLVYDLYNLLPFDFVRRRWMRMGGGIGFQENRMLELWSNDDLFSYSYFKNTFNQEYVRLALARFYYEQEGEYSPT